MLSFNIDDAKFYCRHNPAAGVTAGASFVYDTGDDEMTVTDTSAVTLPDTFGIMHVDVFDYFGGRKYGHIDAAAGNVVIDCSTLNKQRGLAMSVMLVTNKGVSKVSQVFHIANTFNAGPVPF